MVPVQYVGGHAAVEIDVRDVPSDPPVWVTVEQGGTVSVPEWVAHGAPAVPGAQIVDGKEVPLEAGDDPIGDVVIAAVLATSGLLDQPDQWQPAKTPKATKTPKAPKTQDTRTPDNPTIQDGD